MSGELEAAGAAVTAGLVAGAVEGRRGAHGEEAHGDCLNCGATLAGEYCHVCGQPSHISRTLGDVFHDFLHGVLHFDTKAWKTLPLLFFRPGTLTRRYILGQRARFIGPVALFLFTVFLMFLVFAFAGGETPTVAARWAGASVTELEARVQQGRASLAEAEAQVAQAREQSGPGAYGALTGAQAALSSAQSLIQREEAALAEARARRDLYLRARDQVRAQVEADRAAGTLEEGAFSLVTLEALEEAVAGDGREVPALTITGEGDELEVRYNLSLTSEEGRDTIFEEIRRANAAGEIQINTGVPAWDETIRHKFENPELAWYKVQNAAYKFSWLLVPISIPFVALLFLWRRGVTLFDHAVFVLYSLSFVSFMAILAVIFARVFPPDVSAPITSTLTLLIPIHMFFQLKGGYQLGWWSTIWRSVFLWVFAIICLTVFFIAIVLLGLVG